MSRELPRYINVLSICKALGPEWRVERVTRILRNMGIVEKKGFYNYVRPEDLAGAWPEAYEEILAKVAELQPYLRKQPKKPNNRALLINRTKHGESGKGGCDHKWVCSLPATDAHCEKCGKLA